MKRGYFYLFSNTIPVKGYKRSLICDLVRNKYDFIPNSMFNILDKFNGKSIESIYENFDMTQRSILDEYFDFLIKNEYIFLSNKKIGLKFNKKLKYKNPNKIISSIIDINLESKYDYGNFISQLNSINCTNIQIRFFGEVPYSTFKEVINKIKNTVFKHVQIIVHNATLLGIEVKNLIGEFPRIKTLIIYKSKSFKKASFLESEIIFSPKDIKSSNQCGMINPEFFSINIESFGLSQKFNSCLYKKISVDVNGMIKNCPSIKNNFGHLENSNIKKIIQGDNFKKFDLINKDKITTCKDCEFRYVCTDCRVFIENKNDLYSKPEKCNYNPYKAKWEN